MKKTHFILLFLIIGLYSFCGCSSESAVEDTGQVSPKKEKRSTLKKEKKENEIRIPPLDSLQVLPQHTAYVIDGVNNSKAENVRIIEENIVIEGWAIDEIADQVPTGVYITIGEKVFTTFSGMVKPSVAIAYNNRALLRSGFDLIIPKTEFEKGKYPVEIHVIAADMKSVFTPKPDLLVNLIIE